MIRYLVAWLGGLIGLLGLIWAIWSELAPIGFAFLLTGLCLVLLCLRKD